MEQSGRSTAPLAATFVGKPDLGGGPNVSGPGAYGGLQAPAEDDTGVRPGSGTSGQQVHAAAGMPDASGWSQAQQQRGKAAYLQKNYRGAAETGLAGKETSASAGSGSGQPTEGAGGQQRADQLTLIDDDA